MTNREDDKPLEEDSKSSSLQGPLEMAISVCNSNIKRHQTQAIISLLLGVGSVLGISIFIYFYAHIASKSKDAGYLALASEVKVKKQRLEEFEERSYVFKSFPELIEKNNQVNSQVNSQIDDAVDNLPNGVISNDNKKELQINMEEISSDMLDLRELHRSFFELESIIYDSTIFDSTIFDSTNLTKESFLKKLIPLKSKINNEFQKIEDELQAEFDKEKKIYEKNKLDTLNEYDSTVKDLEKYVPTLIIPNELIYGFGGLNIVLISVFTALYRFHQKEIVKNEYLQTGAFRIQAAIAMKKDNPDADKIAESLVNEAFLVERERIFQKKKKEVESPLPGYPSADILTAIINKLIESIDVIVKPKEK